MSNVNYRTGATFNMVVGGVVRQMREVSGLTQAQLAERLQIPASTLSRIENGSYGCSLEQLFDIGTALGTSPAKLMQQIEQAVSYVQTQGLFIKNKKDDSDFGGLLLGVAAITALIIASQKK